MPVIEDTETLSVPMFDERATRRAIRRGVRRTAVTTVAWALVWLLVASLAHRLVETTWRDRGNFRYEEVIGPAVVAANPGYFVPIAPSTHAGGWLLDTPMRVRAYPAGVRDGDAAYELTLRQSARGRLHINPHRSLLPETRLTRVINDIGYDGPERILATLDGLPRSVLVSARVELVRPARADDLIAIRRRLKLCGLGPVYLENVTRSGGVVSGSEPREDSCDRKMSQTGSVLLEPRRSSGGSGDIPRFSWPDSSLSELEPWVSRLRSFDNANFDRLRLPAVEKIRRITRDPRIYGFVLRRSTPDQIRALLADPAVEGLQLAEVELDPGNLAPWESP